MASNWYTELYVSLEKYLKLKIPFEAVHFPSVGVTSALVRYTHEHQNDKNTKKIVIIDMRVGQFGSDTAANHKEFTRLIETYLEQALDLTLDIDSEKNVYRTIESAFKQYLDKGHEVLVVFETTANLKLQSIPEFRDMLVFLDKVRDRTNGKVNLMLTSTYPIFNDESPAPIPMISRFVNLFNPERIYKTAYEDMFQKKISPETLKKIVSVSGDYAYIIKSIQRDLEFYHLKPEAILERQFDQDFFDEFVNVKISLDRIKSQMHPLVLRTMGKLINGAALEPEEEFVKQTYLSKVGILDEHGQVRGKIMPAYCKLYCSQGVAKAQPAPVATPVPVETIQKVMTTTNTERYLNVTAELKIDKISGQILINDINGTYLSEKELKIFALLFRNRGKEVSREAIAKDIWTGHEASSYSDWAMDKLISRIREKLGDARPYRLIKTSRKIGFILN